MEEDGVEEEVGAEGEVAEEAEIEVTKEVVLHLDKTIDGRSLLRHLRNMQDIFHLVHKSCKKVEGGLGLVGTISYL